MSIVYNVLKTLGVFVVLVLLTPIVLVAFGIAGVIDIWDSIMFNRE